MMNLVRWAAVWVIVTVVAVSASWQGVRLVGNQVTDDRPAALTAAEIDELVASSPPTTGDRAGAEDPEGPDDSSDDRGPGGGDDDGASHDTGDDSPGTATSSTTAPSPTTTPPGGSAPESAETRTYNLSGGSTALRFAPEGVTVVWANPNPGFEVEVEPEHVNGVKVEFRSESHRSRVDGWWESGPQDRIREIPD